MKILVRNFVDGTCEYVWKKVRNINPIVWRRYVTEDNIEYNPIRILKISRDYRKTGYVICSGCGKVVKKDKMTKHYEEREREANCMKCRELELEKLRGSEVYTLRSDGKVTAKTVNIARCRNSYENGSWYRHKKIEEVNKVASCIYFSCRRGNAENIEEDFLSKNPNPFLNLLTENGVINKGWKYLCANSFGRQYANRNGKLIAQFDINGVLMYFTMMYRNDSHEFVYSDVYDKFMNEYGKEFRWCDAAETTKNNYIKQIRALYE